MPLAFGAAGNAGPLMNLLFGASCCVTKSVVQAEDLHAVTSTPKHASGRPGQKQGVSPFSLVTWAPGLPVCLPLCQYGDAESFGLLLAGMVDRWVHRLVQLF